MDEISVVNVAETDDNAAPLEAEQGQTPTPESAAETETAGAVGAAGAAESATEVQPSAPEKYDFTLPEGFTADEEALAEVTPLLRELNVPMDKAQALLDLHFKEQQRIEDAKRAAQIEVIRGWGEELKKDPEIGGARLSENLSYANRLLKAHGTPELNRLLVETGMDRQPDMVRFLVKAGKALSEDRFVGNVKGGAVPQTLEELGQVMFKKSLGGNER